MSTMVARRALSTPEFGIIEPRFDLHDGAINPISEVGKLVLPKGGVFLPEYEGAESFRVSIDGTLPPQIDSRHQVYFANLGVDKSGPEAVAMKTYNAANGADNWRKELAAHELARRSGLQTLTPLLLAQTRSGSTLMGTRFVPDLFDLERRFVGDVPRGYEVDELDLFFTSASALAALHNGDVINGDAAPRNFAFRGATAGDRRPVVTDPETYLFPGEHKASELAALKKADVDQLIAESAKVIARKSALEQPGTKRKVSERALYEAQDRARDVIMPVYRNVTGHSF